MTTKQVVCISDIHAGSLVGLCPPDVDLDNGAIYTHSVLQSKIWKYWLEFWNRWIPDVTQGDPYDIVFNGDALDGLPHGSVEVISSNMSDQIRIAYDVLEPLTRKCRYYYHIRGTEAHVGKSAQHEEILAEKLGAIPNPEGQHARYELWKKIGPKLTHFMHHIGASGSNAYESTAVNKELMESFTESARWGEQPPDAVIRSHRHRHYEIKVVTGRGRGFSIVTPGWQAKTAFVHKIAGGRNTFPQFGGILLRYGENDFYSREWAQSIRRDTPE